LLKIKKNKHFIPSINVIFFPSLDFLGLKKTGTSKKKHFFLSFVSISNSKSNPFLFNERLKVEKKALEKKIQDGLLMRGYSRKLREFNDEFEDCKDTHTNFLGNMIEFDPC